MSRNNQRISCQNENAKKYLQTFYLLAEIAIPTKFNSKISNFIFTNETKKKGMNEIK